jgi:uncharacterized RDD family membrane protein YckC
MIEDYADEVARFMVGSPEQVAERRAELVAHLYEADEVGELHAALARLGSPKDAAAVFSGPSSLRAAPVARRAKAAAIDLLPLALITVVAVVVDIGSGPGDGFLMSFPPLIIFSGGDAEFLRIPLASSLLNAGGVLGSVVGLAWFEARDGRTPGKRVMGLRTVHEDGRGLTYREAVLRRACLFGGPFAWIDWIAAHFTERNQRVLDLMLHTMVIDDSPTRTMRDVSNGDRHRVTR